MKKTIRFADMRTLIFAILIGLFCTGVLLTPVSAGISPFFEDNALVLSGVSGEDTSFNANSPFNSKNQSTSVAWTEETGILPDNSATTGGDDPNSTVQLIWQKCFGGSSSDEASSIIQTIDGGYLMAGNTASNDGDVTGNHGSYDFWVVKINSAGSLEWQKCLGGTKVDVGMSVNQTADGGYLISGYPYSNDGDVVGNHGYDDAWVVKLNGTGMIEWTNSLGGSWYDWAMSGIQTSEEGYLIGGGTGSFDGNVTGNHGSYDAWVIKLNRTGSLTWQKCLGGSSFDEAYSVIQTTDGGYFVGGDSNSTDGNVTGNHGSYDAWVVKLNNAGTIDWQKSLGGTGDEGAYSVIQTIDGGYLLGGYSNSKDGDVTGNHGSYDAWIVKLTNTGSLEWQKSLGGTGNDGISSLIQTADGGYLIGGYSNSTDGDITGNHGDYDAWMVKLNTTGSLIWQKSLGGTGNDGAESVIQIADGRYQMAGYTKSTDGDVIGKHGSYDIWTVEVSAQHQVNATADPWTITYPGGIQSYIEGTNATYQTQAKPGADLLNVTVDSEKVGPVSNWTFTTISVNHTISSSGEPTPGQVHAFFTLNTTWGAAPLAVAFTHRSLGSPTSFYWAFGDGTTSTDQDPIHTYAIPGTYAVSLRATNDHTGGIAVLNNAVTVTAGVIPSPTPTPVPAEINAAFSADQTSGTAPLQVLFTDHSTGNPVSWLWDLGDGNRSTLQNVTHVYTTSGTYSVTLSAQNSLSTGILEKDGYITAT
jgi:PKD repeat protein